MTPRSRSTKAETARSARLPELRLKVRAAGRHPWFYRKMIQKPKEPLRAGVPVKVRDREGRFIGCGFYNPRAELALRMFTDGEVRDDGACDVRERRSEQACCAVACGERGEGGRAEERPDGC